MASGIIERSENSGSESEKRKQEQKQAQQPGQYPLVRKLMQQVADLPQFLHALISQQAMVVAGTEAACFLVEPGGQDAQQQPTFGLRPVAHLRNDNSSQETRQAALKAFSELARPAVQQGKDAVFELEGTSDGVEPQFCLVTLLRAEGHVVAVSAVVTRCRDVARAQQRLEMMLLVAGYFELYSFRRNLEQARAIAQQNQTVLQLATTVAGAPGFQTAAMNLCNELASRTRAARVSLGWVKGNPLKGEHVKLQAMSHTEEFDKKQELAQAIVKAMEEAFDQGEIVQFEGEGKGSNNITRMASNLSRMEGGHTVLSLPLRRAEEIVGVLTLEFAPQTRIGPQAATALAVATELLAPQLYDRYQNDRWLITKTALSIKGLGEKAIGPKYMISKLLIVLCIALLAVGIFYKPMFKVTAPFQFVAADQRSLSAPFDGQISEVFKRPGDEVKAGDVLFKLNTYELEQRLAEARAKYRGATIEVQRQRALAVSPASDASVRGSATAAMKMAEQQAAEADAQVKFLEAQIAKATVTAPFDGFVLNGDLKDKINVQVRLGEPLMVVGGRDQLKAELAVHERDMHYVQQGKKAGELATTSLPNDKFPFTVEQIVPLGVGEGGQNVYKVIAKVEKGDSAWLPGMQGEARIDIRNERLLWIWTHRLVEFVRLKLWI